MSLIIFKIGNKGYEYYKFLESLFNGMNKQLAMDLIILFFKNLLGEWGLNLLATVFVFFFWIMIIMIGFISGQHVSGT